MKNITFQPGQGWVGQVASSRKALLVAEVKSDDPDLSRYLRFSQSLCSFLAAPLTLGDDLLGVLMLASKHYNSFNLPHLRILDRLAGPVSIAMRNAQLHHQLQDAVQEAKLQLRHSAICTTYRWP